MAVAKLKSQAAIYAGAVVTAPLAAVPLAQIPLVLASGAVSAAAVAARKIPEYFRGTDNHPGGYAIVGDLPGRKDKGRTELLEFPDGRTQFTPDMPTLMDLPRGTKVVPGDGIAQHLTDLTREEMVRLSLNINKKDAPQADFVAKLVAEEIKTRQAIVSELRNKQDIRGVVKLEVRRAMFKN
jgi:hypothetical protein